MACRGGVKNVIRLNVSMGISGAMQPIQRDEDLAGGPNGSRGRDWTTSKRGGKTIPMFFKGHANMSVVDEHLT